MADTNGWVQQPNPSAQDADGNFGQQQWATRRPDDHVLVYSGKSIDQDPPSQTPEEYLESLATPAALEVAAQEGVDVTSVSGSGKGGKVTKRDVEASS